jgi:hypothetical protein
MTKTEKRRLARSVRKSLNVYLILQEPHIQAQAPDHAERARRCLLAARNNLDRLIEGNA